MEKQVRTVKAKAKPPKKRKTQLGAALKKNLQRRKKQGVSAAKTSQKS